MPTQTIDSSSTIVTNKTALQETKVFLYTTIQKPVAEPRFFNLRYDTLASLGLTILTFSLGFLLAYLSRKIQLRSKMMSNEKFISFWVDAIQKSVAKQADELRRFSDKIRSPDSAPEGIGRVNIHVDKLKALTAVEYVQTFVTNKQGDLNERQSLLFSLNNEIDLLDRLQTSSVQFLDVWKTIAKSYQDEWEKNIHEVTNWYSEMFKKHGNGNSTTEFWNEAFKIRKDWVINSKVENVREAKPVESTKTHFIDKIRPICESYLNKGTNNEEVADLIKLVSRLEVTYTRKILNLGDMADRFKEIADNMEKGYGKLAVSKNALVQIEFKCFLLLE